MGKAMKQILPILSLCLFLASPATAEDSPLDRFRDDPPVLDNTQLVVYGDRAEKGDLEAQALLCAHYTHLPENPDDATLRANFEKGYKWCRQAAERGNGRAQSGLAFCYRTGYGAKQDYAEAYFWYAVAEKSGKMVAPFLLSMGQHLTPEQMAESRKRAEEWKADGEKPSREN